MVRRLAELAAVFAGRGGWVDMVREDRQICCESASLRGHFCHAFRHEPLCPCSHRDRGTRGREGVAACTACKRGLQK